MKLCKRLSDVVLGAVGALLVSTCSMAAEEPAGLPNAPSSPFDGASRRTLSPPAMRSFDAAAHTCRGRYVTRDQYEWKRRVSRATTVLLDVDGLGSVGGALLLAQQLRALERNAAWAYFVLADHAVDAAAAADALADEGFAPVFVIVQ